MPRRQKRKREIAEDEKENIVPNLSHSQLPNKRNKTNSGASRGTTNAPTSEEEEVRVRKQQITALYRLVTRLTGLFFGVDKEIDGLPEKRIRKQPAFKTGVGGAVPCLI